MSSVDTATAADGSSIRYQDRKRWARMLSVVWPLVPFIGIAAHRASGHEAALGLGPWHWQNTMLRSYAVTVVLQGALVAAFGWVMLPFLAIHNVVAWWQLTSANYVEHYGLLRQRDPSTVTGYETPKPHHSWNTNHLVTNLATFHLQRHSDHHVYPSRRYQCLRHFDDLPQLPSGYFGMFVLAYLPWAWFRVMDKRLLALPQVQGDLSRVNLDPRLQQRLAGATGAGYRHPRA